MNNILKFQFKMVPFLVFILFFALTALPKEPLSEDELQAQTKEVAKTLRCMVCQSESVWESSAELAVEMREMIRESLIEGQSPDQIRAYFVSRYGDVILLKPRTFGLNWLLWVGPFLLLAIGGAALYWNMSKWVARTASAPPEELSEIKEEDLQRIRQELKSLKN